MEFKEFYQKYRRMCESYKNCKGCPRDYKGCLDFGVELNDLDELENDVEQWSKEHPQRTRLQDFLEKYPNAPVDGNGTPQACCEHLGYCTKSCDPFELTCKDCWDIPIGG